METGKKLTRFVDRLTAWLTGKKGMITTGVIGGISILVTLFFFLFPYAVNSSPGIYASAEFHSLRAKVLESGSVTEDVSIGTGLRSQKVFTLADPSGKVRLNVASENSANDYYEFVTDTPWTYDGGDYLIRTYLRSSLLADLTLHDVPFEIETHLFGPHGERLTIPDVSFHVSVYGTYWLDYGATPVLEQASDRRGFFPTEEGFNACVTKMNECANHASQDFSTYPELFGYSNGKQFIENAANLHYSVITTANLARITIYSSPVAVAFSSLFLASLVLKATKKKENRDKILLFTTQEEREESESESIPKERKESRFETFLNSHHIRPIFGEWFFRAIGLALVGSCSLMLSLFALSSFETWGEGWDNFALNSSEIFQNISSVGSLMLLVMVIGVIAETRKNLHVSAWCFMTLAVGNYLFNCATLFAYHVSNGRLGPILADNTAAELPGNVFLGIGLFSITGFFLFFNPPRSMINRKVFRFLSLIPTSVALLSVVFTYLYKAQIYTPSYWAKNVLFIRDSSIVFMGIFYEYAIFIFRAIVTRRHGEAGAKKLAEKPYIQFEKNLLLCLVILVITGVFYLIPASQRSYFGFSSTQAFYFVLIPFFFFYRPAGRNYTTKSNIIYYALYAVAWALPSLPDIIQAVINAM